MFRKRFLLLLSLVALSVVLMTVQAKLGPINPLGFISYPLNTMNRLISDGIFWIKQPVHILLASARENKRLTGELAELRMQLNRYREIKAEHERYKTLLDLVERQPLAVGAARIISRSADQSIKAFVLDKGEKDGIEKDMIVITTGGLMGKIYRTWDGYSEVILITDNSFSVSVRFQEDRAEGIMTGTGRGCRLNYISNEVDVKEGDIVVTSGLDRFYPPGIPVGRVKAAQKTTPELFQDIVISPLVDISRAEEVVIIRR